MAHLTKYDQLKTAAVGDTIDVQAWTFRLHSVGGHYYLALVAGANPPALMNENYDMIHVRDPNNHRAAAMELGQLISILKTGDYEIC